MSNLRKVIITAMSSAGSLALILSSSAMAAPPVGGFDNWSVGNTAAGVITANTGICAAASGFTCTTVADGAGFLQQEVTSNTIGGPRYVRTMIAEGFIAGAPVPLANLTFASEDFVQLSGPQGLASKMSIREGTASPVNTLPAAITTGFSSTAQILSGWGTVSALNKSEAILTLGLSDLGADPDGAGPLLATAAGGDEFLTSFNVTANTTLAGLNITALLGVDQTVYVGGPNTVANPLATTERQRFRTLVEDATTAQTAFKFAANTVDPATLAWAIGDKIQVVWAGQDISGAGGFSTESVIRVSTGVAVRGTNLSLPGTFEWTATPATVLNTEFGLAPIF